MATIRPAAATDAQLLPAIERSAGQAFRAIPRLSQIADDDVQPAQRHLDLMRRGVEWVAVIDGAPVGFINGEQLDGNLHIWEMSVAHGHQGSGVGRALMATARQWAVGAGCPAITLTTFRDVPWNQGFYEKLGFVTLHEVSAALRGILENEARAGLPPDMRCAMKLAL